MPARASIIVAAGVCLQTAFTSRARRAQLFEGVDPRLRRFFAGGADVRRLLLHERVERNVAHPAGLGDDVPFDRLYRIGIRTASGREDVGETILRNRVTLARGLRQQYRRQVLVLGDACSVEQRDGVFDLGIGVVGERGRSQKPCGLGQILRHAAALLVEGCQRVLGFRVSELRGAAKELGRARKILREQLAFNVKQGEVVGGSGAGTAAWVAAGLGGAGLGAGLAAGFAAGGVVGGLSSTGVCADAGAVTAPDRASARMPAAA